MKKPIKKLIKKQNGGPQDNTREYYPAGSEPISTEENLSRRERFRQTLTDANIEKSPYYATSKRTQGMNVGKTVENILNAGYGESGYGRSGRVKLASKAADVPKSWIKQNYPTAFGKNIGQPAIKAANNILSLMPFSGNFTLDKPSCGPRGELCPKKKGGQMKMTSMIPTGGAMKSMTSKKKK